MRLNYTVKERVIIGARPSARTSSGAVPMLAVVAVLATAGAIAAGIGYRHNSHRAARYAADSGCTAPAEVTPPTSSNGLCATESATVEARWIHTYRSSHYYRLAVRSADGVVDSIELHGSNDKAIWMATPIGSAVMVRRFSEEASPKQHVTLVATKGLVAQTLWDPEWENRDREFGIWFLSIVAVVCSAGLYRIRARRSPEARFDSA